ncbi:MAG: sensor domain-containing diguanylate cyclase [Colwellia sp.]|nr:sensor domain-containing diguanylate cyclase [Colwellia sp.]
MALPQQSSVSQLILIALLFCLLFSMPLIANNFQSNVEELDYLSPPISIELTDKNQHYSFINKLLYLEDESNTLTISDVRNVNYAANFKLLTKDHLSLGYRQSTIWLRFIIDNTAGHQDDWLLLFDYPLLDEIELYFNTTSGTNNQWQSLLMGDNLKFTDRPFNYRAFVAPLTLSLNQPTEFYVRIRTSSSMQIRPVVISTQAFLVEELNKEMFYGLIYGIMLMMALYNLFLYLAVRDISYLAYVFSVVSGCIFIMALNGHAFQYLWPNAPKLANTAIPLFTSIWMASTAIFTQLFLETKKFASRLYTAINFLIAFAIFSIIFSVFGEYQTAIKIATGLALFNGLIILITSIVCWLEGNRFARFFVGAWTVYGLGTAMLILSRFGVLEDNFVTHNSASIGLLLEIIMLSLALSDKYRVLTQELERQTHELEDKVILRTQELETSNKKLEKLSRIDSLTGMPNRRYFDQQLEQEWQRSINEAQPLSILVCDVDQFKNINDYFGHQYGDKCLQGVAKAIMATLHRPADMPARFGGDEFVVILPKTIALGAELLAIDICQKVQELTLEQAPDTVHDVVTLSIGCATLIPSNSNDIKSLFALADKCLFEAKKLGRNCVVSGKD